MDNRGTGEAKMTIGLDLGDRYIQLCALSYGGEVIEEGRLTCRSKALRARFEGALPASDQDDPPALFDDPHVVTGVLHCATPQLGNTKVYGRR